MSDLGNINKLRLANGDIAHFQDLVSGYTKNKGTVTSIGIEATGSNNPIIVSGSPNPVTSNGTIDLNLKLGYVNNENNRAVQADSNGNLYISQLQRSIQINGVEILGNNTTPLNLKAGDNIDLNFSNEDVTINAEIPQIRTEEISESIYKIIIS